MKKLILLFTILSLVSLCLFSCGNPEESSEESSSETEKPQNPSESETEWNDPEWTPPVK
jgi:hypothetical protein